MEVVLLSHTFHAYRLLPWLRARHPKTALVDYVHTDWFEPMMYGSYAAIAAAHAPSLDAHVATSQALANNLIQRGAAADSTRAISINLDVAEWDPARYPGAEVRGALGYKPGRPLVLYAGRVSNEKRPLRAVAIWKALVDAVGGQGELVDERCGFLIPHGADEIQRSVEAAKKAT